MQCEFCDKPATKTSRQYWYDIFSNDPKGVIGLCQEHENDYGSIPEGYFYCDACGGAFDIDADPEVGESALHIPAGFHIRNFEISFRGLCPECAGKPPKRAHRHKRPI